MSVVTTTPRPQETPQSPPHGTTVALRHQRDSDDAAAIEAATEALAKGTEAFAAQRMNRGIQQALAGKNVASL